MVEGLEFGSPKNDQITAAADCFDLRQRVEKSGRKTETTLYGCQEPLGNPVIAK